MKNISNWKIDETVTASGTREKFWVINPVVNNCQVKERFLFKLPKEGTGEVWAEKVASEVGKLLKLEMMDVSIATYKGRIGLLLRNFVNYGTEELFDGGDLLKTVIEDFNPQKLPGYTIDNVMRCLQPFNLEKEMVKIIIFDALIANQDRHCENWGVIQNKDTVRMAPIFDNGASLGYNNSEERIKLMFKDPMMFKFFTNKSKSLIGTTDKTKPKLTILLSQLKKMYPEIIVEEIDRLSYLQSEEIKHILEKIPFGVMSVTAKQWVEKILDYRKKWLIECLKGEMSHG